MDFTEINHLLELARIELTTQERETIAKDLAEILGYVNQLQEVKTDSLEPMNGGTFMENVMREDEIREDEIGGEKEEIQDELKKAALETKGDYFKVPPVFNNF